MASQVPQTKFVWIIRSWCNLDSFWEHVREHKEFDVAYTSVEMVLEEIQRITSKQRADWSLLCSSTSGLKEEDRKFDTSIPTLDQLKSRPFIKFLSAISTKTDEDTMTSWYVERLNVTA